MTAALLAFTGASQASSPSPRARALPSCYARAVRTGGPGSLRFVSISPPAATRQLALSIGNFHRPIMISQSPACATRALVGHSYTAALRYRSSTGALKLEVLAHTRSGWHVWYSPAQLRARRKLTSFSVLLHPVQGGVDKLALGLRLSASGSVRATNLSLRDTSVHPAGPPGTHSGSVLSYLLSNPVITPPPVDEALGTLATSGRWTVLEGTAHARSVHAVLLQNGKLLIMAGSGNSRMEFEAGTFKSYIYDPIANTWKELVTPSDVFCSGHVQLADGNVLILGGTAEYPALSEDPHAPPSTIYKGENASWIFNIHTEKYEQVPYDEINNPAEPGPLLAGGWYPSATELGNGDVISFGGLDGQGKGDTKTNYYTDADNEGEGSDAPGEWVGWGSHKLQQTYTWFWGLYPSMILTADGRLFYSGSHVFGDGIEGSAQAPSGSSLYDFYCSPGKSQQAEEEEQFKTNPNAEVTGPNGTFKRIHDTPGLRQPDMRDQSAALLLPPAQKQRVMIMGGGNTYKTSTHALNLTDEIDLSRPQPEWEAGPNLPTGRMDDGSMEPAGAGKMYVSVVALPDGKVLETGGSLVPRGKDVHEASIFDPTSNEFTSVAADPVGRDYHSEALLLPDGRVIAFGSNPYDLASGSEGFETRVSVYEPPYLFRGPRPVLDLIDGQANSSEGEFTKTTQWEYGSEHTLTYSSASSIVSATLIRPAAVTHSSDPNQREVELPIASDQKGQLKVSLTSNPNIAPPGYYMVFLLGANGVPSVAQWVHIGPQGAPAGP